MKIDLFILNYNGASYIEEAIRSFVVAINHSRHMCKLNIIDNSSTDESLEIIRRSFPEIAVFPMENLFLCSFNKAVAASQADIIFLLNNDLKADPFFIDPMVSIFETHKDVFMSSAKSFLFDGSYEGGLSIPFFVFGHFGTICRFKDFEKLNTTTQPTFSAGFGAFDREKFLTLGGFDTLYLPGRMEDADLSFRAWRKGWKCYYQPKSVLYHMGGKSFKERFGIRGTMEIAHRNAFLFTWKNIHDQQYLFSHFFFLIPWMIWMVLKGQFEFVTAFFKALGRIQMAVVRRRKEKKISYQLSEREVISFFQNGNQRFFYNV